VDELSPASVRELAFEEIDNANWPDNYKILAKVSMTDVMLVYEDFYNRHKGNLTDTELQAVLNRIGTSIKLGTSMTAVGGASIPPVETRSGLLITFDGES
jgi:hypothetical protein